MTFEDSESPHHRGIPILPPRRSQRVSSGVSELQAQTRTGGVKRSNIPELVLGWISKERADAGGIGIVARGTAQVQGIANGPNVGGQAIGKCYDTAYLPAANH